MFQELLARLQALSRYYQTAHWTVKNTVFYADHLLLDRLYDEASSRIDEVAEKAMGVTGDAKILNLKDLMKKEFTLIQPLTFEASENMKYFEDALKMEKDLLSFIEQIEPNQSVGVRNMLGDLADESQARVYLLNQRISKMLQGEASKLTQPIL